MGDPVCQDGELIEKRLEEVLKRLWDGIARRPKDWVAAWQAMVIPTDKQTEAIAKLINMAFSRPEAPDRAPEVIGELVKVHKVKMRTVEEVLVSFGSNIDGILVMNEDAWKIYAKFLVQVFPKPLAAGWGWSRVGWSWLSWWQYVEKCVVSLSPDRAIDVISLILRIIQDKEGSALCEVPQWTEGDKL